MGFIIGVGTLEPASDLFRRPLPVELACHKVCQGSVLYQFTDLRATGPIPGRLVGSSGSIASRAAIAADLAADRRGRSS